MENAADALKMAAWVLIFVAALSITMNAFSQVRETADYMVEASDREYLTEYIEQSETDERIVGSDSVIPAIYRAFNENYKIIFNDNVVLYEKLDMATGLVIEQVNYIDLEKEKISDNAKEEFLKRILFGAKNDKYEKDHFPNFKFTTNGIWNSYLKDNKFKEELGVYYQEETNGGTNTPDANKTEKRVITYTKQ